MSFQRSTPLPSLLEVQQELPLSIKHALQVTHYRQKIENGLKGSGCFILMMGPCSIHHPESALEYGRRVADLQKELGDSIFLVMRAFLEKPRSIGGWKGYLTDPTENIPHDVRKGIYEGRKLFLSLTELGVPIAKEFLNPLLALYTSDLVTWGSIGARTSASALHRELASFLPLPIGFKNGIDGSIETAIQGVMASRLPQSAILPNSHGQVELFETNGNPYTHLVLRGGPQGSNFQKEVLDQVEERLLQLELPPKILIDCSHDNSQKDLEKQKANFTEVFERYQSGETRILGAMMESYLERGKGNSPLHSLTDPCLGWEETKELVIGCR